MNWIAPTIPPKCYSLSWWGRLGYIEDPDSGGICPWWVQNYWTGLRWKARQIQHLALQVGRWTKSGMLFFPVWSVQTLDLSLFPQALYSNCFRYQPERFRIWTHLDSFLVNVSVIFEKKIKLFLISKTIALGDQFCGYTPSPSYQGSGHSRQLFRSQSSSALHNQVQYTLFL